jgi:hypothetical protein
MGFDLRRKVYLRRKILRLYRLRLCRPDEGLGRSELVGCAGKRLKTLRLNIQFCYMGL